VQVNFAFQTWWAIKTLCSPYDDSLFVRIRIFRILGFSGLNLQGFRNLEGFIQWWATKRRYSPYDDSLFVRIRIFRILGFSGLNLQGFRNLEGFIQWWATKRRYPPYGYNSPKVNLGYS